MKDWIFKTGISLLLILSMLISPAEKIQAETYTVTSDNITYKINPEKEVIIIEGEGTLGVIGFLYPRGQLDPLPPEEQKDFLDKGGMHYVIGEGITKIEKGFATYASIKSIHLPASLKEIEDGAFRDCMYLESIVIPHSVEKIGKTAFENCQRLKTVTNYSSAEVYLPNHSDFYKEDYVSPYYENPYHYNGMPYIYYVDGKISTTVPPGKTAIGKPKKCIATLNSDGGTLSQYNSRRYVYFRFGEPLKLPTVKRKGYTFCGWTAKEHSNYAWRTITNEDTGDPFNSTLFWGKDKDLYAQFAKINTTRPGKRKLKISISKWREAEQLEIQYSTKKDFKKHQSIIVKSSQLMKIWILGKKNRKKHYKLNYNKKKKMLSVTLSKLKTNKKYYFRFQYSGLTYFSSGLDIYIHTTGDWFKKSVQM